MIYIIYIVYMIYIIKYIIKYILYIMVHTYDYSGLQIYSWFRKAQALIKVTNNTR